MNKKDTKDLDASLNQLFYGGNAQQGLYADLVNGLIANMNNPSVGGDCAFKGGNKSYKGGMDIAPFVTSLVLLGIRLANDDKFKKLTGQKNSKKFLNGGFADEDNNAVSSELLGNPKYVKENVANYYFLNEKDDSVPAFDPATGGKARGKARKSRARRGGADEVAMDSMNAMNAMGNDINELSPGNDAMSSMNPEDMLPSTGGARKRRAAKPKAKK